MFFVCPKITFNSLNIVLLSCLPHFCPAFMFCIVFLYTVILYSLQQNCNTKYGIEKATAQPPGHTVANRQI